MTEAAASEPGCKTSRRASQPQKRDLACEVSKTHQGHALDRSHSGAQRSLPGLPGTPRIHHFKPKGNEQELFKGRALAHSRSKGHLYRAASLVSMSVCHVTTDRLLAQYVSRSTATFSTTLRRTPSTFHRFQLCVRSLPKPRRPDLLSHHHPVRNQGLISECLAELAHTTITSSSVAQAARNADLLSSAGMRIMVKFLISWGPD